MRDRLEPARKAKQGNPYMWKNAVLSGRGAKGRPTGREEAPPSSGYLATFDFADLFEDFGHIDFSTLLGCAHWRFVYECGGCVRSTPF